MSRVIDTSRGVTLSVASRMFKVRSVTLRRWASTGDLPAYRYSEHGVRYVQPADVPR